MATHRFTSATQFRTALALRVPKTLAAYGGRVYFDATTQLVEQLQRTTRVDTGYLRASLGATVQGGGAVGAALPPARLRSKTPGAYDALGSASAALIGTALAGATRQLTPITIGYRAHYAPYVEDRFHTMKRAVAQWRRFNRVAIANARDFKTASES